MRPAVTKIASVKPSASPRRVAVKPKTEVSLRVRAMRYLARREHTRAELHAKLLPHVREDENLEAVLDELVKRNWLSDERAAEQLLNQRRGRYGAQRIAHELKHKGIADDLVGAALPELKRGEFDAAREVWQKKFGAAPQGAKEKARQMRFLQSRGFSLETIFKVMKLPDSEGDEGC